MKKFLTIPFLFLCLAGRVFSQTNATLLSSDSTLSPFGSILASRLRTLRARDDLSGWIYAQLEWTAKAPAKRSGQLVSAVRQTWRTPSTPEEQQAWLDLLANEGYSLLLSGAIVPSTDAYTAAYDFARSHPAVVDAGLVLESVLKPLGNNYTRLGDYEQALYIHQKAAALALVLGDKEALAGVYSNLANTCNNMGRPSTARDYSRKGLAVARPRSAIAGLLLSELADAYRELGKTDSAKRVLKQSIDILQSAHDHPSAGNWLFIADQQAGDLYGPTTQALGFYQRALVLQRRLALVPGNLRQRDRAKLYERLGAWYGALGRKEEATNWLDSCLAVLVPGKESAALRDADLYAENTLADALYTLAGLQTDPDTAIRYYELSFAVDTKGRQQLITTSSKERWVADSRRRYEEAIALAWGAWSRTRQQRYAYAMLRFMESSKAQLLLDEVLQQQELHSGDSTAQRIRLLEKAKAYYERERIGGGDSTVLTQLRETGWELSKLRKERPAAAVPAFSVDSLALLLPEDWVTRSYFAGEKALYTIECGNRGIRYVDRQSMPTGWQDSVRAFTHHWFASGANNMIDDPAGYYRDADSLYERFFGSHPFSFGKAYMLLPDGALNLLPVEALITLPDHFSDAPSTWPYVIRQTTIAYGYSLQTLWQKREQEGGKGFSGFFLSAGRHDLPGLQAVLTERSGIEPAVDDAHWYVDSLATTAAFRAALGRSSIVHISSHAFAGTDSLDAPHIEFYDAPFYVFDMQGFDCHPSLVVLSACRTGDGRFVSGEGVQSLARGFTAGGAAAVVAGWWNVNDEATAKLMAGFYAQMAAQSGHVVNAAVALRNSKLAWLSGPGRSPVLQLPYYWAALNYQGNPMPFAAGGSSGLSPAHRFGWWWWLVAAGVIGMIVVYLRRRR
ncbi:MAG TPA: CHAT domain-containing tetratricopeptide repeat protein [Puia sp.]|nr:CHAT domain-containing tetratricopeptide repeat protein [Puia sp.]